VWSTFLTLQERYLCIYRRTLVQFGANKLSDNSAGKVINENIHGFENIFITDYSDERG
jgi:hypothetical protein